MNPGQLARDITIYKMGWRIASQWRLEMKTEEEFRRAGTRGGKRENGATASAHARGMRRHARPRRAKCVDRRSAEIM